jgi:hypothetical protein
MVVEVTRMFWATSSSGPTSCVVVVRHLVEQQLGDDLFEFDSRPELRMSRGSPATTHHILRQR